MSEGYAVNTFPTVSVLTMIFVVLKLTHVIDWSWWWTLSPLWLSAALAVFILIWALIIVFIAALFDR